MTLLEFAAMAGQESPSCALLDAVSREGPLRVVAPLRDSDLVIWPAWEWGERPDLRYRIVVGSQAISDRTVLAFRRLVRGDWYRATYPHVRAAGSGRTKVMSEAGGFYQGGTPWSKAAALAVDRYVVQDIPESHNPEFQGVYRKWFDGLPQDVMVIRA